VTDYVLEGVKWAKAPAITWSFALSNYGQDAANPFSSTIGIAYQSIVIQALQAWSAVSGLTFVQTSDASTTNIRIGFGKLNTATTSTIGLTNYRSAGGSFSSDVIIRLEDPSQVALIANSSGGFTYAGYSSTLSQVVTHEIGHALGLGHSSDMGAIMYSVSQATNQTLNESDLLGITTLYRGYSMSSRDPLVDPSYYYQNNPDVLQAAVSPEAHFFATGWQEGRNPDAYFDTGYYLAHNPDVKAAGFDPLLHFEVSGWKEGRDPSANFSLSNYLAANSDVKAAGLNPLMHFISYGQAEGRVAYAAGGPINPGVDPAYYYRTYGDVKASGLDAIAHFLASGWQEGRNPDAYFDTQYYLAHNPDVGAAHVNPLLQYENYGWKEGRDASAAFSTKKYLASYSDVKAAGIDPLLHYLNYGKAEGRTSFPV
jgi:predicted Zn-dependent protease